MKVSLKDIAREAGVSVGTASLAINDRPGVKFETRRRVMEIAERFGYTASMSAVHLAKRHSGLIGLLVPNLYNLFYSRIVQEIETSLQALGYRMLIATTDNDPARELEMLKCFVSFGADGVILYPLIRDHHDPEYLSILKKNGTPLVFLGGYYPSYPAPYCMSDIYGSFAELVRLMVEGGCRKLLYFGSCRHIVSNQAKIQALCNTLGAYSILFQPDADYIYLKQTNYDCAYQAARRLLREGRFFDGVLAGDAYSCFGVYQALTEAGMRVPDDVALAHLDNMLKPSICICRMTCIEQNVAEIVSNTVDLLLKAMDDPDLTASVLVPTRLIVRDSTRKLPAGA